ncbi:DASH outer kinetochore protein [Lentinula edodes]|uniref:DASH outer kinetochore protein n=1 Tax=Lentinula edodes TaxID=5353 RepID=A0A1Q3EIK0_LENED|nr:DASH outer kinetochore protein [Lentinula edodes]
MAQLEEGTYFEKERDKLSREITSGFEELLSTTNGLNRKLEEVQYYHGRKASRTTWYWRPCSQVKEEKIRDTTISPLF